MISDAPSLSAKYRFELPSRFGFVMPLSTSGRPLGVQTLPVQLAELLKLLTTKSSPGSQLSLSTNSQSPSGVQRLKVQFIGSSSCASQSLPTTHSHVMLLLCVHW